MWYTVLLLLISNTFMTFAWYGHLKHRSASLLIVILVSWGIAFFEYCFQVPANRIGSRYCTTAQLKIIQECISLFVFTVIVATVFKGEPIRWNHLVSFGFIVLAVFFAFLKTK